ncbi:DUF998 domain-containing protein [Segniliparus rugosus]|uniref:DUF998 domain-containing protein n=1 Tax=Segniliparus rugosus (strain ATCC BAA-974 / DSM 45345 / CCUG 50838 / CIP 108380 / JCM 13579 / CDC 945) TaxID=679197 RepID=E5XSB4_SEGRC|nr:DUF998 domain-containing protein [Segniliparus rugosus]EFV12758.1 hypothetical protein HMPREF9336_02386 [Segniliparus rugosus ATCC BAA-974]
MTRAGTKLWALLWTAQLQFFIVYEVVASAWQVPFDWKRNAISDLAAAECYTSQGDGHPVCSPWHLAMGGSFLLTGALMAAGALLAPGALFGKAAKSLLAVGGIGFLIVGLTPRLSDSGLHMTGALLTMVFGNIGLLLAGWSARRSFRAAGLAAALCGLVALIATATMVVTQLIWVIPPGPDTAWALSWFGLIERIVVYPTIVGMIVLGAGALVPERRTGR